MLARGFTGDLPSLEPHEWDRHSGLLLAGLVLVVAAVSVSARVTL
jgi:hypothetical protein